MLFQDGTTCIDPVWIKHTKGMDRVCGVYEADLAIVVVQNQRV